MEIVRNDEEINQVLELATNKQYNSLYPGMTYEQGIIYFYKWLTGETDDNPLEN